ncbi:helix-turn-helix transcriptional regulator [Schumannella luteola]|uniref:Transcriptional regulator with XRE-family HTH domain n=1 Tax=Schumannella luteola TaxID=472059 RepID=A0A852YFY8_9MICO|nr:helix-turn-helix transcriptional regulator [Schumannella luteola]NYH00191.1 transcriptional regulator with XRE-family HTH domain [Schumannella luteola]TPX04057.1 helix-turn-helix transcriptional regulator [Schumannella luteola]
MDEFAQVLRAWRDRVRPEDAGLPAGAGRRTPGLRREELALLAGVSVDYIVRLEQGRATHPSSQLLGALARALRLDERERDHLYRAAGAAPPSAGTVPVHITPGVQRMLDRCTDTPVAVYSATWDLLRWNELWAALHGDPSTRVGIERNVAWRTFVEQDDHVTHTPGDQEAFAADIVGDLRTAVGRYPEDAGLRRLITRLSEASPDFARRWSTAHVAEHRVSRKIVHGSAVGDVTVDCDVLTAPGSDLRLVLYTAVPGSEDAEKLRLLRVAGTQRLTGAGTVSTAH